MIFSPGNDREYYFNNLRMDFPKKKKIKRKIVPIPLAHPTILTDMMKGNITNVLPMVIGE